jgi:fatty-acid desaturase
MIGPARRGVRARRLARRAGIRAVGEHNYWTHDRRFGTRRYDDARDNAMNIAEWLPVTATFSACWQNNHHHYSAFLRLSHHPSEYDFGFLTVRALKALGLVKPSETGIQKPADLHLAEIGF